MEIDRFQETSQISLDDLRENVPGFVATQNVYIFGWYRIVGVYRE